MPAEEGAEEEHEEGLLTGHAGTETEAAEPEETPREVPSPSLPGYEREGDLETLSELSEAPTENLANPGSQSRWKPDMALFYPLLHSGRQTRCEAMLNLLNNLLGAGLLTMPKAMAEAGLITGLAAMGIVAVANRYTLLQVLWMSHSVLSNEECSYPELGRHVFGQKGLIAVLVSYLVFTLGILSSYLIVLVDLLALTALRGAPRLLLVFFAVLMCTPAALLRSLRHVALVSAVCMLGVGCLVVVLTSVSVRDVLSGDMENAPIEMAGNAGDVDLFRGDLRRFLSGTALFSLQFSVQAGGIEVLSRVDHGQNEEAPNSMSSLLAAERISEVAFTLALFLSATLGTAAYLRFGDKVAGNVLLDFNPSYAPLLVSWISYGFVVVCSFAFIMVPCRLAALDVLALRRRDNPSIESVPKERFMSLTAALLGVCAVVAWTVTDLSHVLKFVGVWATMVGVFLCEPRGPGLDRLRALCRLRGFAGSLRAFNADAAPCLCAEHGGGWWDLPDLSSRLGP
ncbi:unnamed protein product [Effrenium voratum]|uniref:Amino acid transporter transmembrane domain-containing protein n=1 Tax=Effrenium voratum TaxID=2562239 RepID=A0AA36JKB9_9DINO|nr:unnamed protein product [Effrenium voratum]